MDSDNSSQQKEQYFFLSTLARGLQIIELLAQEGELSVSEVARRLGLNRTSSHRYLATLKHEGYAKQNQDSKYNLTYKVFELGSRTLDLYTIREEAWPLMQKLALQYNETVNFACLDGTDVIHLDKAESAEILRIDSPLGSRAPAYCTALGKAILAFLPDDEIESYLENVSLDPSTPNTITDRKKLLLALAEVRKEGVAEDNEELAIGLRCVASPILNRHGYPKFAISISGISARMTPDRIVEMKANLRSTCESLSTHLRKR